MSRIPHVLIIDDETDLCFLLSSILNNSGYITQYAHSLKDGLSKIYEYSPDVILLDMNLPDGNGLDFVKSIKKDYSKSKLVVMSAHVSEAEVGDVLKLGADFFLLKPINKKSLMMALAS